MVQLFRKDFLDERGLGDFKEVSDIKSQIPRLTGYLRGKLEWKCGDVYEMITTEASVKICRSIMKELFMPIYFPSGRSLKQLYKGDRRPKSMEKKKWIDRTKLISLEDFKKTAQATKEIIGESYKNYIFIATSIIEILTLHQLIKNGHKVFNIYDGFYSNEDIGDLIEKTVSDRVKYFKHSLLNFENFKKL